MKKTIIIDESILRALEQGSTLFRRGSIVMLPARSAEEVLQLHRSRKAQLLVLEHVPPALNGARLCRAVRGDAAMKDVSVILVCPDEMAFIADCRDAGANAVLTMPLDTSELFATVSQLLMVQQRLTVRVPVSLSVSGSSEVATVAGMSEDLSVSGMLLESGQVLQSSDRLRCSMTLDGRPLAVEGIVVRSQQVENKRFRYGIKFHNLDAKAFVLIEHFVKSRLQDKG